MGSKNNPTTQQSFNDPVERSKEVLKRCAREFGELAEHITIAVSGGTDSVVAADVFARFAPEFGLQPDSITHINTGASIPQSRLVAEIIADIHDLEFIEQGYRKLDGALAVRVLNHGWPGGYAGSPATGGHGLEWANRKDKPMNAVYMMFEGFQIWVSGARKLESKKRQGNVPDSGVNRDKPRRAWCSVIGGWTSSEKQRYIKDRGLPVSESYLVLGFSGECTACAFDNQGLLTDIDLLSPELGYCLRTLAVWLYQRVRRGDIDLSPKRLCWGWDPDRNVEDTDQKTLSGDTRQAMVGCDTESCKTRERPNWILGLPDTQIVTRSDITEYWESGSLPNRFPLT